MQKKSTFIMEKKWKSHFDLQLKDMVTVEKHQAKYLSSTTDIVN